MGGGRINTRMLLQPGYLSVARHVCSAQRCDAARQHPPIYLLTQAQARAPPPASCDKHAHAQHPLLHTSLRTKLRGFPSNLRLEYSDSCTAVQLETTITRWPPALWAHACTKATHHGLLFYSAVWLPTMFNVGHRPTPQKSGASACHSRR